MKISQGEIPHLGEEVHLGLDVFPHTSDEQTLHLRVDLRLDPQLLIPLVQLSPQIDNIRFSFQDLATDISLVVFGRRN